LKPRLSSVAKDDDSAEEAEAAGVAGVAGVAGAAGASDAAGALIVVNFLRVSCPSRSLIFSVGCLVRRERRSRLASEGSSEGSFALFDSETYSMGGPVRYR
jgi:hypothetical protein